MKYVIITPAKDEEKYIENTLKSVTIQTLLPWQWIVVDDGSMDNTAKIIKDYQKCFPWIKLVRNKNTSEKRMGGEKVVRAFYCGFKSITNHDYEFIVKLDADLTLPKNYFENVINAFKEDAQIGLCGGYCIDKKGGLLIKERVSNWHLRGAIKTYRKSCFEEIGGLKEIWNWDGFDEMKARYLGWKVKILPNAVIHHRVTSSSYNAISYYFLSGKEKYKEGDDILLAFIRSLVRFKRKPFIICGLSFFTGYLCSSIQRPAKYVDKDFQKFIRTFHYKRIIHKIYLQFQKEPH